MMKLIPVKIEPEQKFIADKFRDKDAEGIVNLFLSVYGTEYPIRKYYSPEKLIDEHRKKNIYMIVAKTDKGDIDNKIRSE